MKWYIMLHIMIYGQEVDVRLSSPPYITIQQCISAAETYLDENQAYTCVLAPGGASEIWI